MFDGALVRGVKATKESSLEGFAGLCGREREEDVIGVNDKLQGAAISVGHGEVAVAEVYGREAVVVHEGADRLTPGRGSDGDAVQGLVEAPDGPRGSVGLDGRVHKVLAGLAQSVALNEALADVQLVDGVVELVRSREKKADFRSCRSRRVDVVRIFLRAEVTPRCEACLGAREFLVFEDPFAAHDARVFGHGGDVHGVPSFALDEAVELSVHCLFPQRPSVVAFGLGHGTGFVAEVCSCLVRDEGEDDGVGGLGALKIRDGGRSTNDTHVFARG
mmetsp:Transcript_17818/g.43609  ORF Transcript_17818/g.43609 Transcript_17818/m.43609 type:complete len:275 (-) Transcript_17818:598-1422(-)